MGDDGLSRPFAGQGAAYLGNLGGWGKERCATERLQLVCWSGNGKHGTETVWMDAELGEMKLLRGSLRQILLGASHVIASRQ